MVEENQPITIDGHAHARDLRVQLDGRSHRRSRCKAKMRRRAFHYRHLRVVWKRISMYGLRGVRVGEASNPGLGRAASWTGPSSADTDPTLLDDFARDLEADVTHGFFFMVCDSSRVSGGDCSATSTRHTFQWKICCPCRR